MSESYVPAVIPPDAARDARVAARRTKDAVRAGAALDRLLGEYYTKTGRTVLPKAYHLGWSDGYAAAEEHHNRHYGVPDPGQPPACPDHSAEGNLLSCAWCGEERGAFYRRLAEPAERCGQNLGPLRGTCDLEAGHGGPC